jgi:hypothetical protein
MGEDMIVDGDRGRHGFVLADSVTMRYPELLFDKNNRKFEKKRRKIEPFPREGVEAGDVVVEKGDDGIAIVESDEDAFKESVKAPLKIIVVVEADFVKGSRLENRRNWRLFRQF